jgi:hypothetical protein
MTVEETKGRLAAGPGACACWLARDDAAMGLIQAVWFELSSKSHIRRLLGTDFTDADGTTQRPNVSDFLVVGPYNMQSRCLRDAVPPGVEVGAVDRLQGSKPRSCSLNGELEWA